jgi:hypothetical protein
MQAKTTARPYGVRFAQTLPNAKPHAFKECNFDGSRARKKRTHSANDKRRAYSAAKTKPKNTTAPASAPVLVDDAAPVYCGVAGPEDVAGDGTTDSTTD